MIDPGDIARKKIYSNWHRFGSILVDATYNVMQDNVYDTDTGDVASAVLSSHGIKVVVDKDLLKETKNQSYMDGDFAIIFPALYLSSARASVRDVVLIDASEHYVVDVQTDPARATYTLHLRKR